MSMTAILIWGGALVGSLEVAALMNILAARLGSVPLADAQLPWRSRLLLATGATVVTAATMHILVVLGVTNAVQTGFSVGLVCWAAIARLRYTREIIPLLRFTLALGAFSVAAWLLTWLGLHLAGLQPTMRG